MSTPPSTFQITNAQRIDAGALTGKFDVNFPSGLIVRGAMLLAKNGKQWCAFPSKEFVKRDGTKSFSPLIEFTSRDVADKFWAQVMPIAERALAVTR